jgi:hypothetical protein
MVAVGVLLILNVARGWQGGVVVLDYCYVVYAGKAFLVVQGDSAHKIVRRDFENCES